MCISLPTSANNRHWKVWDPQLSHTTHGWLPRQANPCCQSQPRFTLACPRCLCSAHLSSPCIATTMFSLSTRSTQTLILFISPPACSMRLVGTFKKIFLSAHRAVWSPVTIKINPSEKSDPTPYPLCWALPSEEPQSPCAKVAMLRALRECREGIVRLEDPTFTKNSGRQRNSKGTRPSALKPLIENGELASFVPRSKPQKSLL